MIAFEALETGEIERAIEPRNIRDTSIPAPWLRENLQNRGLSLPRNPREDRQLLVTGGDD
jgi:hypothetical protein